MTNNTNENQPELTDDERAALADTATQEAIEASRANPERLPRRPL